MNELEKQVMSEIRASIGIAVKERLSGYGNPFAKLLDRAVSDHEQEFRGLLDESIRGVFADESFRKTCMEAVRHKVAKELVASFGEGIFKKTVDQMKSDPTVRARCILAVEAIVSEHQK